ncbi:MAG: metal-sensitive transcriptional regulator [Actinomycetota bacterium]
MVLGLRADDHRKAAVIPRDHSSDHVAGVDAQVRGPQVMPTEDRNCREVVTQLAATFMALDQVGIKLLASGLSSCLENQRKSAKAGYSVDEVEKLFLKLS